MNDYGKLFNYIWYENGEKVFEQSYIFMLHVVNYFDNMRLIWLECILIQFIFYTRAIMGHIVVDLGLTLGNEVWKRN